MDSFQRAWVKSFATFLLITAAYSVSWGYEAGVSPSPTPTPSWEETQEQRWANTESTPTPVLIAESGNPGYRCRYLKCFGPFAFCTDWCWGPGCCLICDYSPWGYKCEPASQSQSCVLSGTPTSCGAVWQGDCIQVGVSGGSPVFVCIPYNGGQQGSCGFLWPNCN